MLHEQFTNNFDFYLSHVHFLLFDRLSCEFTTPKGSCSHATAEQSPVTPQVASTDGVKVEGTPPASQCQTPYIPISKDTPEGYSEFHHTEPCLLYTSPSPRD